MKKLFMMAAIAAVTGLSVVSCDNSSSVKLNDDVDSLVYDLGIAQSEGLKQYMSMQLGVDTTYLDEFIKGMKEGALNEADPKKEAYMKGIEVGKQIQQMSEGVTREVYGEDSTKTVNVNVLLGGVISGLKGQATKTAEQAYTDFQNNLQPIKDARMEKEFGANKAEGEKYLKDNAKKEGVKQTKSGLQYKVLVEGDGELPAADATVKVNYEGRLIDGTVFDSSYQRNQPFEVDLAQPRVIAGWVEVLKMMPAGSKWEVTIPQELAYGSQNMGQIKPFSTLVFTIEVLK